MSVLKIKDAEGNWQGVTAIKGEKGDAGTSPKITVSANNSSTYKLRITTEDKEFVTPNLKGSGGIGGNSGNISSELGTIDNYKDFNGENIPCYNMDLPPLPCYKGGTRYAFERQVIMYVYMGEPDENGNYDIDKYSSYLAIYNGNTGLYECNVPCAESGFLTDYLIYNPIPKKEWDTWENPNLVNILPLDTPKIDYEASNGVIYALPNYKFGIYNNGDAWITYDRYKDAKGETHKTGSYDIAVYNRTDFPFILDEPVQYCAWDSKEKNLKEPVPINYPSAQWNERMNNMPKFKIGMDCSLDQSLDLNCCGEAEGWGNIQLMNLATIIKNSDILEGRRNFDWVVGNPWTIKNKLGEYNAQPIAPAMYVGLAPLKNYTIETTSGDCALILPGNNSTKFITKSTQLCYPSTTKAVTVRKTYAQEVGTGQTGAGAGGGVVTGSNSLNNGTVIYYDVVDTSAEPVGTIEVPTAVSCPNVYLKRGESYTFQVEDEDSMYGVWVFCENEDDYKGIKIVEGIEPYSTLMSERMASGATKFNIKVYTASDLFDDNEIMAEYNIKLTDNTTEGKYCRFLNANTIKHFDLDDFTMNGHTHSIKDVEDIADLKVPKMIVSTNTLADGVSELAENTFHFVYNE